MFTKEMVDKFLEALTKRMKEIDSSSSVGFNPDTGTVTVFTTTYRVEKYQLQTDAKGNPAFIRVFSN